MDRLSSIDELEALRNRLRKEEEEAQKRADEIFSIHHIDEK